MKTTDLTPLQDDQKVLVNPHKGWYHHYFDNAIKKYPSADADVIAVAGMDHVYLRLAWAYLEPRDGEYNWKLIDDIIERFTAKGYGISFRITCKETDDELVYATPQWVKEAGAKGRLQKTWGHQNWRPDCSESGGAMFEGALHKLHATYIGYHGWAKDWLDENPELTRRLANRCGYWYFPQSAAWPDAVKRGEEFNFSLTMLNRGVAPAYHRHTVSLRLRGDESYRRELTEFDNRQWMPDVAVTSMAPFRVPREMPAGKYSVEVALFDGKRPIELALRDACVTDDGYYRLGEIAVRD